MEGVSEVEDPGERRAEDVAILYSSSSQAIETINSKII